MDAKQVNPRAERQDRVAKVVWGILLITAGVLLTLDNIGRIELAPPSQHPASNAVDGDLSTRWASAFSSPQWIEIDLGATAVLSKVKLRWENAHAAAYQIQVSDDDSHWTTPVNVTDSKGGEEEHELSSSGRYVRLNGLKRSTPYGYSLFEFEVYGVDPGGAMSTLLSRGKKATASSLERGNYWLFYWPLLLVAFGIPPLIAPKNDGDQVWGIFLAVMGVLMQLHAMDVIPWGFVEMLPLVLVLAGALLVLQSLRRGGSSGRPDGQQGGGL